MPPKQKQFPSFKYQAKLEDSFLQDLVSPKLSYWGVVKRFKQNIECFAARGDIHVLIKIMNISILFIYNTYSLPLPPLLLLLFLFSFLYCYYH